MSPITFPGAKLQDSTADFDKTGAAAGQLNTLIHAGLVPAGAQVRFGDPRTVKGFHNQVSDMFLSMTFDASSLLQKWIDQVNAQGNQDGCSNSRVHSIHWDVMPNGSWEGFFHVKYIKRACFWFFGNVQQDLATIEIDFRNQLSIVIAPDGSSLKAVPDSSQSNNVPEFIKPLLQLLNNLLSIYTLGLVPVDAHVVDAYKNIDFILDQMNKYNVLPQIGAASETLEDIKFNTVFTDSRFSRSGDSLLLTVTAQTAPDSLLSRGQACVVHDSFLQLRAQSEIPQGGVDYSVQPGDNVWKIADHFYGNGRYFPVVTGLNEVPHSHADQLPAGKVINIQRISTLRKRDDVIITLHGDSLWKMSHDEDNKISSYSGLLSKNKGWIEDPNVIYPVEFVKIPSSEATQHP